MELEFVCCVKLSYRHFLLFLALKLLLRFRRGDIKNSITANPVDQVKHHSWCCSRILKTK